LKLKKREISRALPARRIPIKIKEKFESTLKKLEGNGIITQSTNL